MDLLTGAPAAGVALMSGLFIGAVVVAVRRRLWTGAHLIAMCSAAMAIGGLVLVRVPERNLLALHNYLWAWVVGACLTVAVLVTLGHGALRRAPAGRAIASGASALTLLVAVAVGLTWPPRVLVGERSMAAIPGLAEQMRANLEPGSYQLTWNSDDLDEWTLAAGLLFAVEDDDVRLFGPRSASASIGPHRVTSDPSLPRLVVAIDRERPAPPAADARLVATHTPDRGLVAEVESVEEDVRRDIEARSVRLADGTVLEGPDAVRFVRSGDYATWAGSGFLAPAPSRATIERLRTAQAGPVFHIEIFLMPATAK